MKIQSATTFKFLLIVAQSITCEDYLASLLPSQPLICLEFHFDASKHPRVATSEQVAYFDAVYKCDLTSESLVCQLLSKV